MAPLHTCPRQPCAAGKFQLFAGSNSSGDCRACAAGKYSDTAGASSEADCRACPSHSQSGNASGAARDCRCNVGYSGPDGGPCQACAAGTFKDVVGNEPARCLAPGANCSYNASHLEACAPCRAGFYSQPAATACTGCTALQVRRPAPCTLHPKALRLKAMRAALYIYCLLEFVYFTDTDEQGYYCPSGSASLEGIPCPAGSYCLGQASDRKICPDGTWSPNPGVCVSVCVSV